MGMEKVRTSDKQDQWKIEGAHPQYDKLVIYLHVKGEKFADKLIDDSTLIEATVRALEHKPDGTPVIHVTGPEVILEAVVEENKSWPEKNVIALPTRH